MRFVHSLMHSIFLLEKCSVVMSHHDYLGLGEYSGNPSRVAVMRQLWLTTFCVCGRMLNLTRLPRGNAVAEFHAKAKTGNCVFVVAQHAIYKIYEMYGIP